MRIIASIVTYNTDKGELKKCLDSLIKSPIQTIYICDNSPKDELKTFCSSFDKVTYIYNYGNLGYGAGHNVALRYAIASNVDYHLVINSDVYFEEGTIERCIEYMNKNIDVGQMIPNVIYPDGSIQYVCRLLPSPVDLIFRRFLPKLFSIQINYRFLLEFADRRQPINAPFHMGCFMLFRISALKQIGLFDESIFMYAEDIDITRRMHRKFRTMYWPEVTIVHAHRAASYRSMKMLKIHMISMVKYFNKWGWIFDKERKVWNRDLLKELGYK